MSKIEAWRFLVSRNQFLDYRTVVAPDFMCEANTASLLAKTAEGDLINGDNAYYREIYDSKVGDLTIIYRVSEAQSKYINAEIEGILKDSFGREIYFIEGIVVKGIQTLLPITIENLGLNHNRLVDDYRDFWEWVAPQSVIPSELIAIELEGIPLQYIQVDAYGVQPSSIRLKHITQSAISNAEQSTPMNSYRLGGEIHYLKFLDSARVLAHQYDKKAIILNLKTDEKTVLIRGGLNRYIRQVALSADSKLVYTANIISGIPDRNILKRWNLNNSIETDIRESNLGEFGRVDAIAFSFDGSVAAAYEKNITPSSVSIKLIDIKSGGIRGEELSWHTSDVSCIESSPLDNIFASGDRQGVVIIWNWKNLKLIGSLHSHRRAVNAIAFSPRQEILVSGDEDGKIKITGYKNGIEDQGLLGEYSDWVGGVNALAFSLDGKIVASGGDDGKVKLWNIKDKILISELSGHDKPVMSVSFSPNGKLLASGSKDKTVRIWQIN